VSGRRRKKYLLHRCAYLPWSVEAEARRFRHPKSNCEVTRSLLENSKGAACDSSAEQKGRIYRSSSVRPAERPGTSKRDERSRTYEVVQRTSRPAPNWRPARALLHLRPPPSPRAQRVFISLSALRPFLEHPASHFHFASFSLRHDQPISPPRTRSAASQCQTHPDHHNEPPNALHASR
jgi:hypothetical protein